MNGLKVEGRVRIGLESVHDLNFRLGIQNKVHTTLKTDIIKSSDPKVGLISEGVLTLVILPKKGAKSRP